MTYCKSRYDSGYPNNADNAIVSAVGLLEAEKRLRRIQDHRDLWILA